jgi:hypothetical protein
VEHVIDFRCLEQGQARPQGGPVRLTGDEWRLARDQVVASSGCATATVEHEVASPTPGAKGYAVAACGRRWLCSAGNGMAACAPQGGAMQPQPAPQPEYQLQPTPGVPPPPPPPPVDAQVPTL